VTAGPLGDFCDSLHDLVAHVLMWDEINLAVEAGRRIPSEPATGRRMSPELIDSPEYGSETDALLKVLADAPAFDGSYEALLRDREDLPDPALAGKPDPRVSVEDLTIELPGRAGLHDVYETLHRIREDLDELNSDGRIVIGGQSAGAALAAGTCLLARDEGTPLPDRQILCYPTSPRTRSRRPPYRSRQNRSQAFHRR
jgi:alpha/beta hydrolase fold